MNAVGGSADVIQTIATYNCFRASASAMSMSALRSFASFIAKRAFTRRCPSFLASVGRNQHASIRPWIPRVRFVISLLPHSGTMLVPGRRIALAHDVNFSS